MVRMPHWPVSWPRQKKYDLERMSLLLSALGNPHDKLPPVIHVAGTNGKGSTIAYLHAILAASGYKVHIYTSPHLLYFNERIVIASEYISDSYLFSIMERTRIAAEQLNIFPTFFEGVTAAAFIAFAENKADVLLLETGLGGRLDATNVVKDPTATVITPISYDHAEYLGPTLETIAREKAGIIKHGTKSIVSLQPQSIYDLFIDYTNQMCSHSAIYEYDFGVQKLETGFLFASHDLSYQFSKPRLLGDHQIINAATAIATCVVLKDKFHTTSNLIDQGIRNAQWPGRLTRINLSQPKYNYITNLITKSLCKNDICDLTYIPQIWVDGAHNIGGALALATFIKEYLTTPTFLIIGMTKDRDAKAFSTCFANIIMKIFTVGVLSEPESYGAETLATLIGDSAGVTPIATDSLMDSLVMITRLNKENNILHSNVIITGSLFLVSDFYDLVQLNI